MVDEPIAFDPLIKGVPSETIEKQKLQESRPEIIFFARENSDTNAGGTTVYEVPNDRIAFITSVVLSFRTGAVAPTSSTAFVRVIGNQPSIGELIFLDPPDVAEIFDSQAINPSIPIKLISGDKIVVESDDNNLFSRATVSGYEVITTNTDLFLSDFI